MRKIIIAAVAAAAALTLAPSAHADPGDQASANQAIVSLYTQVQARCTPTTPPSFRSIHWDTFQTASSGSGLINDANSALGGFFTATWDTTGNAPAPGSRRVGNWDVELQFC